jgi:hypothetical protein
MTVTLLDRRALVEEASQEPDPVHTGEVTKETQVIQDNNQTYLLDVLSNIKSKEQITKLSPYAYFLNGSGKYESLDYMSTEALIERIKNGL